MTRDDIIKLAREAGDDVEHTLPSDLDFLSGSPLSSQRQNAKPARRALKIRWTA